MRLFLSTLFMISVATMLGCSDQPGGATASAEPINDHCPIMGDPVQPEGGTVEWDGKTIGFCCAECVDEWKTLTEEEKPHALAHAGEEKGEHNHEHGDDEHGSENKAEEPSDAP